MITEADRKRLLARPAMRRLDTARSTVSWVIDDTFGDVFAAPTTSINLAVAGTALVLANIAAALLMS